MGDQPQVAWSLRGCGFVAMITGQYDLAQAYIEHSLEICQSLKDDWGLAWTIYDSGYLALAREEWSAAEPQLRNASRLFREYGIRWGEYRSFIALGDVMRGQCQWGEAETFYHKAILLLQDQQFSQFVAGILEGLAQLALVSQNGRRAVRLFGAAQQRRNTIEMNRWVHIERDFQRGMALLREQLSEQDITTGLREGESMPEVKVFAYALKKDPLPG